MLREYAGDFDELHLSVAIRGLVGLVLIFDVYTIYQQLQIYRIRHQLVEREELFRLISENAADMIAVGGPERAQRSTTAPPICEFSAITHEN